MAKGENVMKYYHVVNNKWLVLVAFSTLLVNCDFGGKNADPLKGQEVSNYVSSTERVSEHKQWEDKFKKETDAYQKSIRDIQARADERIKVLEEHYNTITEQLRNESSNHQSTWLNERERFMSDFNQYKTAQDAVIADLKSALSEWENQAKTYKQLLENPEKQTFQGLLYRLNISQSLPRSIEWTTDKSSSYSIFFKMDFGHEAVVGVRVQPELPQGLSIVRKDEHVWTIEGAPNVVIPKDQELFRSLHYLVPILDLNRITDTSTRSLVAQQSFEESIMIVVHSDKLPSTEGSIQKLKGDN